MRIEMYYNEENIKELTTDHALKQLPNLRPEAVEIEVYYGAHGVTVTISEKVQPASEDA